MARKARGGFTPAASSRPLATNTAEAAIEAVEAAHKHGAVVSYDLNYCASLWKSQGGKHISNIDPPNFKTMIARAVTAFTNFKVAATTLRNARTASVNDWGTVIYAGGQFYEAPNTAGIKPRPPRRGVA